MLIRLWHLLVGHRWKVDSSVFNPAAAAARLSIESYISDDAWMCIHGFTVVARSCSCGARSVAKLVGNHATDPEVEELRRMIR